MDSPLALRSLAVDGHAWQQVQTFAKSTPDDPHYMLLTHADGVTEVVFGDGKRGRIPPADSRITAVFATPDGNHVVTLERANVPPTQDMPLWTAIRSSGPSLSFGTYDRDPAVPSNAPTKPSTCPTSWVLTLVTVLALPLLLCVLRRPAPNVICIHGCDCRNRRSTH
jgi:hypothetical protein